FLISQTAFSQSNSEGLALKFIEYLSEEQFAKATAMFSPAVAEKLKEEQVTAIWKQINQQVGSFETVVKVDVTKKGEYEQALALCRFQNAHLNIRLVFDQSAQVAGLFFLPAEAPTAATSTAPTYQLPQYADEKKYAEEETLLNTPVGDLKAIYTYPNEVENPPVIVFVHGSGPNDEDATLGPNKIFKDLAAGLASNGIASYRYVKRSKAYPASFSDQMTIDDEVVDDAVKAVTAAKNLAGGPVFLLGHSLGGLMAPKIAMQASDLAGLILLAAPNRALEDLMIEQIDYIIKNAEGSASSEQYLEMKKVAQRIQSGNFDSTTPKSELMNIPPSYWQDLTQYDPLKMIKRVKKPVLVLQGERDYQVTMVDFERWKSVLKKRGTYQSYPKLNHLFFSGQGLCLPAEYGKKGFFDKTVLMDIVGWVTQNR
ncbi:MAG: alpha/beta fold hydrolase, partial [Bacteroidota bacterium]